jgi:hypothetical protein
VGRRVSETAEWQTLWNEFFAVFGIKRRTVSFHEIGLLGGSLGDRLDGSYVTGPAGQ